MSEIGRIGTVLVCALLLACGDDSGGTFASSDSKAFDPGGAVGVAQGGAQDFGALREILEAGEIPAPEVIDSVGFFNEHKIELPEPDCNDDICIHGLLGVMGNLISGSNCTMVMVGMNTPIDPAEVPRPPLNLALVIDTSGSMAGEKLREVQEGLDRMLTVLEPEDRVHLVSFDDAAEVLALDAAPNEVELVDAIGALSAAGSTNIYDGLRTGLSLVEEHAEAGRQNRVLLLSDGEATSGIAVSERIVGLARAYAETGIAVSTIGLGGEFDPVLMREVAESGAGSFYFIEDAAAVHEVFVEEASAFLIPLAESVTIELDAGAGYDLRAVYGTRLFQLDAGSARIDIPTLQIAHRREAEDDAAGRRGGGGAMIFELLPRDSGEPGDVGVLSLRYRVPGGDEIVEQTVDIRSPLDAGETPSDGFFAGEGVGKAFVMLNILVGFQLAAEHAEAGEDGTAVALLESLAEGVGAWLDDNPDPDLADDLTYVERFIDNLEARATPARPAVLPEPWPRD